MVYIIIYGKIKHIFNLQCIYEYITSLLVRVDLKCHGPDICDIVCKKSFEFLLTASAWI